MVGGDQGFDRREVSAQLFTFSALCALTATRHLEIPGELPTNLSYRPIVYRFH